MSMYSFGNSLYSGKRSYNIVGRRKWWFSIAIAAVLISFAAFLIRDPNLGIEFRGGSQFTVSSTTISDHKPAYDVVAEVSTSVPRVSNVGQEAVRVQTESLDDQKTQQVRAGLAQAYQVDEKEVTSTFIGPSWGQDILAQAIRAMVIFMALISIVLMIYFRSWTIAVGAIGALLHDFIVTLGVYWLLGLEVTPATIIGLLTIMGYSLYDTVVVFDKVRENTSALENQHKLTYAEEANLAINQTLIRSLNTSITGLLPVLAVLVIGVWWLGADTLRDLSLVMFVGMFLSAISSIFVAAPVAVALAERDPKIKAHTERVREIRGELADPATETNQPETVASGSITTERVSGGHRGQGAQPKRKKRNKR
ncbi:protein translocase subunit SecF [Trueperella pecoris]|uniref:Protein-export membrane protein SecF n=1 Tax=Trueperella pecoris TaxID=2733571 RepID=A0A7M1QWM3_9ACTO|nr:protein translocase subunit SecF [Trueperella pecoris]QOQ38882.1 protein translocase subunit SecF [Trueperella pecoris]QOR46492.1 protein translocase subunit SecF [Trueperella pecoris]QTG76318.1 protein translocase subunit SecF [Trueperella pecoris]